MKLKDFDLSVFSSDFERYFGFSSRDYAYYRQFGCLPLLSSVFIAEDRTDRDEFLLFVRSFNNLSSRSSSVKFFYIPNDYVFPDGSLIRCYSVFPGSSSTNVVDCESWFSILDKIFNYEVKK